MVTGSIKSSEFGVYFLLFCIFSAQLETLYGTVTISFVVQSCLSTQALQKPGFSLKSTTNPSEGHFVQDFFESKTA